MRQIVLMLCAALLLPSTLMAQTYSNRHHLSDCTTQSAPIILPYADARTIRLGLPADLEGRVHIREIHGYDEETRLRIRGRGVSLHTQGGGAVLTMPEDRNC